MEASGAIAGGQAAAASTGAATIPGVRRNNHFEEHRLVGAGFGPAQARAESGIFPVESDNSGQGATLRSVMVMIAAWEAQHPSATR